MNAIIQAVDLKRLNIYLRVRQQHSQTDLVQGM